MKNADIIRNQGIRRTHQKMNEQSEQEDPEEDGEEEEETLKERTDREKLENSRAIVQGQQTDHLLDFQNQDGTQLFSSVVKKPGTQSPVIQISKQPIVTEMAQVQSWAASVSIPIKEFISNEALQKQCQEKVSKASKRKEETGKELQHHQKEQIQRVAPEILRPAKEKEPILRVSPEISQIYKGIIDKNAPKLHITIPTDGTEERRITQLSLDAIVLDNLDDEPVIIEEVKAKESAGSEKVAETEDEEVEGVAEVSVADKEEETAMDTEVTPSVGAPEVAILAPVTPMEIST